MSTLRQHKILIVEDEEYHRLLAQLALEQAGYRVVTAATGYEALDCIATSHPDLVILDMGLEDDMDGLELLAQLKADDISNAVPVMVLSADILREHMTRAMDAGAVCYMTKPYRMRDLVGTVQRILSSCAKGPSPGKVHSS